MITITTENYTSAFIAQRYPKRKGNKVLHNFSASSFNTEFNTSSDSEFIDIVITGGNNILPNNTKYHVTIDKADMIKFLEKAGYFVTINEPLKKNGAPQC